MTTTSQRPIPTVQASPALLRAGDMVHPDWRGPSGEAFTVLGEPERGPVNWRIHLDGAGDLVVPLDGKVRAQRRPQPQPTSRVRSEDDWEPDILRRRVPARSP